MPNQTVILTWKTGGDFHFTDVNLLAYHIHKQYRGDDPLIVYCLTDTVKQELKLKYVTLLPAKNPQWNGWWIKMNLFDPEMEKYRPFLYMDLDTAVVNPLVDILPPKGQEDKFICLSSFFTPPRANELQSGMMWFAKNNKQIFAIWNEWIKNPNANIFKFHRNGGDQSFFRSVITMCEKDWQSFIHNRIWSFKINPTNTKMDWLKDLPNHLSVVCFHGTPRIPVAAKTIPWVSEYVKEVYK